MLRSSILAATAAILCTAASAQQTLQAKPVPGAVRDGGTYHVATQTWTRSGGQANISPDYIFRNDTPSGYFGTGFENCKFVDEIILPGPNNPAGPGSQDSYLVDGFSFSYCKTGVGSVDWQFCFYDSYVPCDDPCSPANCICQLPTVFTFTGLPGGSACWIFTVDLAGGYELCIDADGGVCAPGYDGGGLGLDGGGIGACWTTADGGTTGPILAGNPNWIEPGSNTCYAGANSCGTSDATGLGAQDLFGLCDGGKAVACALGPGCYFFGGYVNTNGCGGASQVPFASFDYGLFADCTQTCTKGDDRVTEYCGEDQNANNTANIIISGNTLSQGPITVGITNAPPNQFGYLLIGSNNLTVSQPPGAKGDLCVVGGFLGRYDKDVVVISAAGDGDTDIENSTSGGPNYGIPNGGGNIQGGETWYFQYWHRQPMGAPATFSSAICVDFKQ